MKIPFLLVFSTILTFSLLLAQESEAAESQSKPTIAVIDFEGDANVNKEQLSFIAGKISQEFADSKNYVVLDRGRMEFILQEQGFQESGACSSSECRVEIGQMLGVEFLVAGKLVRFGPTYMLSLDYLDVQTGEIKAATDVQQKGELHEIVQTLCSSAVQKLSVKLWGGDKKESITQEPTKEFSKASDINEPVKLEPVEAAKTDLSSAMPKSEPSKMSTKRKWALVLMGGALSSGGAGAYFNFQGNSYANDYEVAKQNRDEAALRAAYDNTQDMSAYRTISYGTGIGLGVVGLVLWFWPEGE